MNRLAARIQRASHDESGFTLIELLVTMLILGILASIAMPAFFNQKGKANDARAKTVAHNAQVAMETCATDTSNGAYTTCDVNDLRAIDPSTPTVGVEVTTPAAGGYTLKITAVGGNTFSIVRGTTGSMSYPCTVKTSNRGGCPGTGTTDGTWG